MSFSQCPRCNSARFEQFKTHAYCSECNYTPTLDSEYEVGADDFLIPQWALDALMRTDQQPSPEELIIKRQGNKVIGGRL